MNIKDYNDKMYIINDFYQNAFNFMDNVNLSLKGFKNTYGFDLINDPVSEFEREINPDIDEIVDRQKQIILINLGAVGERIIKYLLLINQIYQYPNQNINEFNNKKIYDVSSTKAQNYFKLDQNMKNSVNNIAQQHLEQPKHDYSYLYKLLNLFYPKTYNDIEKTLLYFIKKDKIVNSNLPELLKAMSITFIQDDKLDNFNLSDVDINNATAEFNNIVKTSGDSFTVLRYIDCNPNNKQYDIKLIYDKLNYLLEYIKLIHEECKDDITMDITEAYNKKYCNYFMKREHEKIEKLFNKKETKNSSVLLKASIFKSKLTFEEIEEICLLQLPEDELAKLISNNITKEYYDYFNQNHLSLNEIVRIKNNSNLHISDVEDFNLTEEDLRLSVYLPIPQLLKVRKNNKLYIYLKNKPEVLEAVTFHGIKGKRSKELFNKIIEFEEIKENPSFISILYYEQLLIYEKETQIKLTTDEIIKNIKDNYKVFGTKDMFAKLPVMLPHENNIKIYTLLVENGLSENLENISNIKIFCIPYKMVYEAVDLLNKNNIPVIVNNNVSKELYEIIEVKRKQKNKDANPIRNLIVETRTEREKNIKTK